MFLKVTRLNGKIKTKLTLCLVYYYVGTSCYVMCGVKHWNFLLSQSSFPFQWNYAHDDIQFPAYQLWVNVCLTRKIHVMCIMRKLHGNYYGKQNMSFSKNLIFQPTTSKAATANTLEGLLSDLTNEQNLNEILDKKFARITYFVQEFLKLHKVHWQTSFRSTCNIEMKMKKKKWRRLKSSAFLY